MHIDITAIDKYIINKNKQFHQFDETAYFAYKIFLSKITATITSWYLPRLFSFGCAGEHSHFSILKP